MLSFLLGIYMNKIECKKVGTVTYFLLLFAIIKRDIIFEEYTLQRTKKFIVGEMI